MRRYSDNPHFLPANDLPAAARMASCALAALVLCFASIPVQAQFNEEFGVEVVSFPTVVGEGDRLNIVLSRAVAVPQLQVFGWLRDAETNETVSPPASFQWGDDETGERVLSIPLDDDTVAQGDRQLLLWVSLFQFDVVSFLLQTTVTALDNDREARAVLRGFADQDRLAAYFASDQDVPVEVVLDGDATFDVAAGVVVRGDVQVFGNGATLRPLDDGSEVLLRIAEGGGLALDRTRIRQPLLDSEQTLLRVDERLTLQRSAIEGSLWDEAPAMNPHLNRGDLIAGTGSVVLDRSVVRGTIAANIFSGQTFAARSSTVMETKGWGVFRAESPSTFRWSSVVRNLNSYVLQGVGDGEIRAQGTLIALTFPDESFIVFDPPPPPCWGNVVSEGFNRVDWAGGCPFAAESDIVDFPLTLVDPDLPPLPSPNDWYAPSGDAIDAGEGCPAVDQRGTPRPQTLVADAEPRCEIGAIELGINPYRGAWIPERSGHGVDLQTAGNRLLLAWYTYTEDGEPTAYQALAPLTGPSWQAPLQQARRDPESGVVTVDTVGEVGIDFDSNTEATLRWQFGEEAPGSERISAYLFAPTEPRFEVTGLWYPPADSGNGASIVRRGEVTAVAVYYYDEAGKLRWALGTGDAADAVEVELRSYTGFCPNCDAAQDPVQSVPAGRALVHFLTPNRARVDTDIAYPGPAGGQWQRSGADFVPINDLVANDYPLGKR